MKSPLINENARYNSNSIENQSKQHRVVAKRKDSPELQEVNKIEKTDQQYLNASIQTVCQSIVNYNNKKNGGGNKDSILGDLMQFSQDYYIEYVMLHKLQALTKNFTCQSCMQVLNFVRFFNDEHECLKKIIVPVHGGNTPHIYRSHLDSSCDVEENKKTKATMFGPIESSQRNANEEVFCSADGLPTIANIRYDHSTPGQSTKKFNPQSLQNKGVAVAEINLNSREGTGGQADMRQNMSFQLNAYNSDNSFDIEPPPRRATVSQAQSSANVFNGRHKVNQMQLEVYVQKLKEYRIKLDSLQEELVKCQ